ncbi:molecular chaperone [Jeongeupia sp. USM3]|uniref:fimbrial biogenesis chaperone n=1 Tax=Jeongeupia sp. USM3 TaxID=1906741 RepID=UPI00196AE034|nr:molecular chaperone [Jeongeupia sp. USM3]
MRWLCVLLVSVVVGMPAAVQAGVIVESSRVVFAAGAREQSLLLANSESYPILVQVWIDDGKPEGTPETAEAPVMPLPAIFRLEPGEKKNLRLLNTAGAAQPRDRESLYWLNVYAVPPRDAKLPPGASSLTVAIRLQLKVFFRPKLAVPVDARLDRLRFSMQGQGEHALNIENPTPYFVTLSRLKISGGGGEQQLAGGMIAPFSAMKVAVDDGIEGVRSVDYAIIDDDGNEIALHSAPE